MRSKDDRNNSDDQRDILFKQWQEYGKTNNVFVPGEQPFHVDPEAAKQSTFG